MQVETCLNVAENRKQTLTTVVFCSKSNGWNQLNQDTFDDRNKNKVEGLGMLC